jgi:tetratricopeptide (TPR) repeat protein
MMLGELPGAAERAERIKKLEPAPAAAEEANDVIARALLREHRAPEAIALLARQLPSAARGETGALLMEAYADQEQLGETARVFRTMPLKLRGSVDVAVARARLSLERARQVQAESLAQAALERLRAPTAPRWLRAEALLWLGRAQWEQGIFRPAQRLLKQATDLDPQSARAFFYLARVDEDLSRADDARAALETATRIDPKLAEAQYELGLVRQQAHDPSAKEAFQAYLQIAPKGLYADEARRAIGEELKPTNSPPRKRRRGR